MFEFCPGIEPIFIQKWVSVDMNLGGVQPPTPTIPTLSIGYMGDAETVFIGQKTQPTVSKY